MDRLALYVGYVGTTIWAASMCADFVIKDYDPPAGVHGLMLLIAGAFFGKAAYQSAKRRGE